MTYQDIKRPSTKKPVKKLTGFFVSGFLGRRSISFLA